MEAQTNRCLYKQICTITHAIRWLDGLRRTSVTKYIPPASYEDFYGHFVVKKRDDGHVVYTLRLPVIPHKGLTFEVESRIGFDDAFQILHDQLKGSLSSMICDTEKELEQDIRAAELNGKSINTIATALKIR